jgi:bifunctional non-homologous end joining protein LigD
MHVVNCCGPDAASEIPAVRAWQNSAPCQQSAAVDGKSFTNLPLIERKENLRKFHPESNLIKYYDHVEDEGKLLFKEMQKMNLEGTIAKKKNSKDYIGRRTSDWLKIKNVQSQEAINCWFY